MITEESKEYKGMLEMQITYPLTQNPKHIIQKARLLIDKKQQLEKLAKTKHQYKDLQLIKVAMGVVKTSAKNKELKCKKYRLVRNKSKIKVMVVDFPEIHHLIFLVSIKQTS